MLCISVLALALLKMRLLEIVDKCDSTDVDGRAELTIEKIVSKHVRFVDCKLSDIAKLDSTSNRARLSTSRQMNNK